MNGSIKINYIDETITMNAGFAKSAMNTTSPEYKYLQKVRQDFPTYRLEVRKIKKNIQKKTFKGLTYEYMRNYIRTYENKDQIEQVLAELDHKIDISHCHSQKDRYPVIKKWFLEKYPAIAQYGNAEDIYNPNALPPVDQEIEGEAA